MVRIIGGALAVALVVSVGMATTSASSPDARARQDLPEGAGKAITLELCAGSCHGVDKFIAEHRSKSQWIETIEIMKTDGATGTEPQFKAVVSYLLAHFGVPVKINTATAKQIDDMLDLEPGQAEAIVKYRDEHGPFAGWKAFLAVPGLDAKKLEEQKGNVVF